MKQKKREKGNRCQRWPVTFGILESGNEKDGQKIEWINNMDKERERGEKHI